ncbi:MAG TPA: hypothetical protein VME63_08830 [Dyella sp.]|uniref:hypothetical protein n=1 Tax=Dyella sp. TaxID=1869338 RepID=UPI002C4FC16B|nr:hypothetical protein [Dyella sp.]HTV85498.1 hypothetical protein [Dyella sp.]
MAIPDWVSYVSLAGGIVGTISGCLAYRRTGQLKALDLRLELRKVDSELRNFFSPLSAKLDYAKRSRERIAAVTGGVQSGPMQKWLAEYNEDLSNFHRMEASLPTPSESYRSDAAATLESKLVMRHNLMIDAKALLAKYEASVVRDDKERESLRDALQNLREPR